LADIALYCVQFALNIAVPWWVVRHDLEHLPPEALDRAWNTASFWSAVVGFGFICIPVHFIKVRRSFGGALLGLLWMAGTIAVIGLVSWLLARLLGKT